jgi:hypothetical protein
MGSLDAQSLKATAMIESKIMKIVLPDCSVLRSNAYGSIAADIQNLPENMRELGADTVRRSFVPMSGRPNGDFIG